jgi:hypothetical protein
MNLSIARATLLYGFCAWKKSKLRGNGSAHRACAVHPEAPVIVTFSLRHSEPELLTYPPVRMLGDLRASTFPLTLPGGKMHLAASPSDIAERCSLNAEALRSAEAAEGDHFV